MTDKELIATAREKFSPGTRVSLKETDLNGELIGDPIECEVIETLFEEQLMLVHLGNSRKITLVSITEEDINGKNALALIGVSRTDAASEYDYHNSNLSDYYAGMLLVLDIDPIFEMYDEIRKR